MTEEDLVAFKLGFPCSGPSALRHLLEVENLVQFVFGQDSLFQDNLSQGLVLGHGLLRDLRRTVVANLWSEPSHHHQSPLCIFQATLLVRGDSRDTLLAKNTGPVSQYRD